MGRLSDRRCLRATVPILLLLLVCCRLFSVRNVCLVLLALALTGGGGVNQLSDSGTSGVYNRVVDFLFSLIVGGTYNRRKVERWLRERCLCYMWLLGQVFENGEDGDGDVVRLGLLYR
jgi:hypothetical protein